MSKTERLVEFELMGHKFSFYTEEDEQTLAEIFSLVHAATGDSGKETMPSLALTKVSVLGCLKLASDYLALRESVARKQQKDDLLLRSLNEKLLEQIEK